jgi:hypothetical protein
MTLENLLLVARVRIAVWQAFVLNVAGSSSST